MITETDGQTGITYIGAPLDEALIQAVRDRDGINAHNAEQVPQRRCSAGLLLPKTVRGFLR